jgi:hypothetical protein
MGGNQSKKDLNRYMGVSFTNPSNVTTQLINEFQSLLSQVQKTQCSGAKKMLVSFVQAMPDTLTAQDSDPVAMKERIDKELSTGKVTKLSKDTGIDQVVLVNSIKRLTNILIDNAVVNGKVDGKVFKKNVMDILNSVCPEDVSKSSFGISENNKKYLMVVLAILAIFFILRGNGLSAFGRKRR